MTDAKRTKIREKIAAGLARQEARDRSEFSERAAAARDKLTSTAREHPLMLIAGGLAVGVAVSALFPRSPTRKLSKKTVSLLAMLAELGVAYGRQAMETAGEVAEDAGKAGKEKLGELSDAIGDGADKLKDQVAAKVGR